MSIAINPRLRRHEASLYLKQRWGIDRKPTTLATLACTGGGPRYQLAGRIPLYPASELDLWAEGLLSPLKTSTSDLPAAPHDKSPTACRDAGS